MKSGHSGLWAVAVISSLVCIPLRVTPQRATTVAPIGWVTFTDTAKHFHFQHPPLWKSDTARFSKNHYTDVYVSLNSMGMEHFNSLIERIAGQKGIPGPSDADITDQLPKSAVFMVVGWQEGPAGIVRFGPRAQEMEAADLTSVMSQSVEVGNTNAQLISRDISFVKWGHRWKISIYLKSPVSTGNREIVEQILKTFTFDGVPAGDVIWAIGEARKRLPPEAHPNQFETTGENGFHNVTTRREGANVIVTFSTQEPGQKKMAWEFRVTEAGTVVEIN
jgi:hypothetical protein